MTESPTDICAECGHRRRWHIPFFSNVGDSCCYPIVVRMERTSSGKVVGYILHVDTCEEFVEPPEVDE